MKTIKTTWSHWRLIYLMSPAYEIQVVLVQELCDDVGAEGERNAAIVLAPSSEVTFRIRPEQVADQSVVRHRRRTCDLSDLKEVIGIMDDERLLVDLNSDFYWSYQWIIQFIYQDDRFGINCLRFSFKNINFDWNKFRLEQHLVWDQTAGGLSTKLIDVLGKIYTCEQTSTKDTTTFLPEAKRQL